MGKLASAAASDAAKPRWWRRLFLYPTFFGALLGAIPTAIDLYKAFDYDVGYSDVKHAEEQRALWIKNFACAQNLSYQQVKTADGLTVQVGACTNGDVLIEVIQPDQRRILEWISLERIKTAAAASALPLIATAHAGPVVQQAGDSSRAAPFRLAQAQVSVKCQTLASPSKIIRIVSENGKCFREEIEVLKGRVSSRKEVPCSTSCP
ncbi:MAG: hypothetical protein Kow0032_00440 [Methyloligellaceae bacterium]